MHLLNYQFNKKMARKSSAERAVELIDEFLEDDVSQSSDNELDVSIRSNAIDEDTCQEVILTNMPNLLSRS